MQLGKRTHRLTTFLPMRGSAVIRGNGCLDGLDSLVAIAALAAQGPGGRVEEAPQAPQKVLGGPYGLCGSLCPSSLHISEEFGVMSNVRSARPYGV